MRDHDLELIAALVEGRLEDETDARALIASSPEAREEYEAQKVAYQSLRAMGNAPLSESERATLHRDLWTELRAGTPKRARTPWYLRWVPVAAGLFVIVGLVAVLGGGQEGATTLLDLGDGGGDETARTSTTAGDTATEQAGALSEGEAADDGAAPTTTEAMSAETTVLAEADTSAFSYAADAENVRAGEFSADRLSAIPSDEVADSSLQACLTEAISGAGLSNYDIVASVPPAGSDPAIDDPTSTTAEDTSTTIANLTEIVVAVPSSGDLATSPVAFIDLQTCRLVYLDQP